MLPFMREDRPSAARRWVARSLLSKRTVIALQDIFKRREPLGAGPHLDEVGLEYAALGWIRILLQLAGGSVHAKQAL